MNQPYEIFSSSTRVVYRMTIKQTVLHVAGSQTFNFDIEYNFWGKSKICFSGGACGPESNG